MPPAEPGRTASSPSVYGRRTAPGFLRVVSPDQLAAQDKAEADKRNQPVQIPPDDLGNYIRQRWYSFRDHRNSNQNSINDRLLRAQRMFEGQYDPQKLMEIQRFGGSMVYSRLVAVKCRGATSLLRDVYLGADRPWSVEPEPDPAVPPSVAATIAQIVASQAAQAAGQGQQPDPRRCTANI